MFDPERLGEVYRLAESLAQSRLRLEGALSGLDAFHVARVEEQRLHDHREHQLLEAVTVLGVVDRRELLVQIARLTEANGIDRELGALVAVVVLEAATPI